VAALAERLRSIDLLWSIQRDGNAGKRLCGMMMVTAAGHYLLLRAFLVSRGGKWKNGTQETRPPRVGAALSGFASKTFESTNGTRESGS